MSVENGFAFAFADRDRVVIAGNQSGADKDGRPGPTRFRHVCDIAGGDGSAVAVLYRDCFAGGVGRDAGQSQGRDAARDVERAGIRPYFRRDVGLRDIDGAFVLDALAVCVGIRGELGPVFDVDNPFILQGIALNRVCCNILLVNQEVAAPKIDRGIGEGNLRRGVSVVECARGKSGVCEYDFTPILILEAIRCDERGTFLHRKRYRINGHWSPVGYPFGRLRFLLNRDSGSPPNRDWGRLVRFYFELVSE